jgi:hypothetical protein
VATTCVAGVVAKICLQTQQMQPAPLLIFSSSTMPLHLTMNQHKKAIPRHNVIRRRMSVKMTEDDEMTEEEEPWEVEKLQTCHDIIQDLVGLVFDKENKDDAQSKKTRLQPCCLTLETLNPRQFIFQFGGYKMSWCILS